MRWRSTALSSIFVEMNPRPKSMMYRELVELCSIVFLFCTFGALESDAGLWFGEAMVGIGFVARIVLDVVRSPWIMLFLWRSAVCSPSFCMTLNCLAFG